MNFELSDEQQMLQESVVRLLGSREARHPGAEGEDIWAAYAELGLLAMNLEEADGGLGMGPVETMLVMRAIGKGPCTSPFLASAVYGTALLSASASPAQRARIVPSLIDGSARLAVALDEPGSRYRLADVQTTAAPGRDGFVLSGRKSLVLGGSAATHFIVSARLSSGEGATGDIGLFLVPCIADGLRLTRRPTIDGRTADDLELAGVRVPAASMLAEGGEAAQALELAFEHATVACLNEAVGAMEELLAMTVDYLKVRRQFGTAIGTFQALQHRAVDMLVEVEQAKSMALYATMQLVSPADEHRAAIAQAKLHINRAARLVGESAVQLHGAIGMTTECKAGRLFNRLAACQIMFGDSDYWLSSVIETTPDILAA